jgi:hypothetical protein
MYLSARILEDTAAHNVGILPNQKNTQKLLQYKT